MSTSSTTNGSSEKPANVPAGYVPPKVWTNEEAGETGGKWGAVNQPTAGARFDKDLPIGKHPLQLYSLATPNGQKAAIMLEELLQLGKEGAEYDAWKIGIMDQDQFGSGFVEVNPNSKIPALMDQAPDGDKKRQRVFESGNILLYLAEKFDNALLPKDQRTEVLNWLFWQMGSGPYLGGGFGHFYHYAPYKQEYPINRFTMETKRQLDVLEKQLKSTNAYIAGDEYTIADICIFPWYGSLVLGYLYGDATTFLDAEKDYPHLIAWAKKVAERPAVKRGLIVNKTWGDGAQLKERHDAKDIDEALEAAAKAKETASKL